MKIRVEVKNKEELDEFIKNLSTLYNITFVSKLYKNTRNNTDVSRAYIEALPKQ